MGYNIRTGLVKQHATLLTRILQVVISRGDELRFDCDGPDDMSTQKYQLLRIIRATHLLKDECNGQFSGLYDQVRVCEDWPRMAVVVKPAIAHRTAANLTPYRDNEHDTLAKLKQFEGQMDLVRFTPTPDFILVAWQQELRALGFDLVLDPDNPGQWIGGPTGDEGEVDYAVARIADSTPSGFALLSAFNKESSDG